MAFSCVCAADGSGKVITEKEVRDVQAKWAQGIVDIGRAYRQGSAYAPIAERVIDELYAYGLRPVQFKPTKAADTQFRDTRAKARSYFIGGDRAHPEDTGFALTPWTAVRFEPAGFTLMGDAAMSMGNYYFTDTSGKETKVEYTFGYCRDEKDNIRIFLHHSSLPFAPAKPAASPPDPKPAAPAPAPKPKPVGPPALERFTVRPSEVFNVRIPTGTQRINMNVNSHDQRTLLVTNVQVGPIADFNRANPSVEVGPGDRVESINGIEGDSKGMLDMFKQGGELALAVRRCEELTFEFSPSCGATSLGISCEPADTLTLNVTVVHKEGLLVKHSKAQPKYRVGVNDRVCAINGIRGDATLLMDALGGGEIQQLTVRRIFPDNGASC